VVLVILQKKPSEVVFANITYVILVGEVMMGCDEMELGDSEECLNFSLV
jgi:hypothetical protein